LLIYILFEILAYFAYYDLKVAKEEELNSQNDTSPILNQDILSNDGRLWIVITGNGIFTLYAQTARRF